MTAPCHEIQSQAAGLASLAPDDRERRAAEAHASSCAACARALAEGAAVIALVDTALPLAPPRPEALARARQELLAELAVGAPAPVPSGGRSRQRPSAAGVALTAAVLLLSLVLTFLDSGPGGIQPLTGLKCAAFELAFALVPLVATFVLARRGSWGHGVLAVAAAGSVGALIGQAALHLSCPALPSTGHSLVFHTLPVLLALALGVIAGRRTQRRALPP